MRKILTDNGSVVTIYSKIEIDKRNAKKKSRSNALDRVINDLILSVSSEMKHSDTAAAVALILCTYERVGNDSSALTGHFGVSNLLRSHIKKCSKYEATLEYTGKSGVKQVKIVREPFLVELLYSRRNPKNNRIFETSPKRINEYLSKFGITSKDIRTYAANKFMKISTNPRMCKKEINERLKSVAGIIGHKPSTLKNMYLHEDIRRKLWGK